MVYLEIFEREDWGLGIGVWSLGEGWGLVGFFGKCFGIGFGRFLFKWNFNFEC